MKDTKGIYSVAAKVSDLRNSIIAWVDSTRSFLIELNDTYLNTFLADWPPENCRTRPVALHALPVLAWMPEAVQAADKKGSQLPVNI